MFDDLDETIRQILIDEVPIKAAEIGVEFDQPKREWSARLSRPTVNLFLYDIRENATLRNFEPQYGRPGGGTAARKRPPVRLDCHYIMTAWAPEAADEHRLLARSMQALFRYPEIPAERLTGRLRDQAFTISTKVASNDKLPNPAEVWSALDNEVRPSVSYIITVAMDPWTETEDPVVSSFEIRTYTAEAGSALDGADGETVQPVAFDARYVTVGGIVRDADGNRVPYARVAIRGTGFVATADDLGRYRLRGLNAGTYPLVVWGAADDDSPPQEREIVVPGENFDVQLT